MSKILTDIVKHPSSSYNNLTLTSDGYVNGYADIEGIPTSIQLGAGIIEAGSNTNGSYVKYSNGVLICWKQVVLNVSISTANGSLYFSSSTGNTLGNWPVAFSATPATSVKLMDRSNTFAWVANTDSISATACGYVGLYSSASRAADAFTISILGIGGWS
jgi:hypothetical protein